MRGIFRSPHNIIFWEGGEEVSSPPILYVKTSFRRIVSKELTQFQVIIIAITDFKLQKGAESVEAMIAFSTRIHVEQT